MQKIKKEAIASGLGASALGVILGGIASVALAKNIDADIPIYLGPVVFAIVFGGGAFASGYSASRPGQITRNILGKATLVGISYVVIWLSDVLDNILAYFTAIPGKIANAAQRKAEDAVDELKKVPGKVTEVAASKVDETVQEIKKEIKKVPSKVAAAAAAKVEETKENIKAAPARIADSTKKSIEKTIVTTETKLTQVLEELESADKNKDKNQKRTGRVDEGKTNQS